MAPSRVLIMGVGNVLMGDEGIGVHAVRLLEQHAWQPHVSMIDGCTFGFNLISSFGECDVLLMIDATLDGRTPGTVSVIEPRYATDFPKALSAHDIGLKDLVESAALLGMMPRVILVTISVADLQPMQMTMSPAVDASLPRVVDIVRQQIAGMSA